MRWEKEIKRYELYIKYERVSIMRFKCWTKAWEFYEKHGFFPAWDNYQSVRLSNLLDKIMNEIKQID